MAVQGIVLIDLRTSIVAPVRFTNCPAVDVAHQLVLRSLITICSPYYHVDCKAVRAGDTVIISKSQGMNPKFVVCTNNK